MNEYTFYNALLVLMFALSPCVFLSLLYFTAPYGRHASNSFGICVSNKIGWFFMESAVLVSFDIAYFLGSHAYQPVPLFFLILWHIHYIDRSIIFPLRMHDNKKSISILTLVSGVIFNTVNGYLNGRYLSEFSMYSNEWFFDLRFLSGLFLFFLGFLINRRADSSLLKLKNLQNGYQIPYGKLFDRISCPNYLGEIIEWWGWAIATWSLPGLAFAIFTTANLIPRALSHHKWYQETFSNYPRQRYAIIPYLL